MFQCITNNLLIFNKTHKLSSAIGNEFELPEKIANNIVWVLRDFIVFLRDIVNVNFLVLGYQKNEELLRHMLEEGF